MAKTIYTFIIFNIACKSVHLATLNFICQSVFHCPKLVRFSATEGLVLSDKSFIKIS